MPDKSNRIFDIVPREKKEAENDVETTFFSSSNSLPEASNLSNEEEFNQTESELLAESQELDDRLLEEEESLIEEASSLRPNDEVIVNVGPEEIIKLEWDASDREELQHRLLYFICVGIIAIIFLVYFTFKKDFTGVLFLAIICVAFVFYKLQKPRNYHYTLSNFGIYIDDKFYDYSEIHSFWVINTNKQQLLHLIFNKKYFPQLTIDIKSLEVGLVRANLQKHIPEQENIIEPITDKVVRLLKL